MSAYRNTTTAIAKALSETLREVDLWFDSPSELVFRRPAAERWSIAQILEHITLTNHFLLLVIRKQTARALKKAVSGASPPAMDPTDIGRLDRVASYGSFPWVRPEHMEPSSNPDLQSVRQRLSEQMQEAQGLLASMPSGEGALVTVTMSVDSLGRLNLYEWLLFLAHHAKRHLGQLQATSEQVKGMAAGA